MKNIYLEYRHGFSALIMQYIEWTEKYKKKHFLPLSYIFSSYRYLLY